ncbi:hypothetical protein G6F57_019689 [Rhizopus arrhizus]|nr:hypothetical protein G6F57_019689 [Rhizopus arrhizus]
MPATISLTGRPAPSATTCPARGRRRRVVADRHRGRHAQHHRVDLRQAQRQHVQRAERVARARRVDDRIRHHRLHTGGNDVARQRPAATEGGIGTVARRHRNGRAQHHRRDVGLLRGADRQRRAARFDAAALNLGVHRVEHLVDRHARAHRNGHARAAGLHADRAAHGDGGDGRRVAGRHPP